MLENFLTLKKFKRVKKRNLTQCDIHIPFMI